VGPSLYISDPVTSQKNWSAVAASGTFGIGGNWSGGTAPGTLHIANVRHVSGGNQTVVVAANATVWELNVSGSASQTMTVELNSGVTLTTFSGVNVESNGAITLQNSTLDAQFVEIIGGTLRGAGLVKTGSGPVPGQVENRGGTVAPGNGVGTLEIDGRYANSFDGTLAIELGGLAPGTEHDQLIVHGGATLAGPLTVSLVNGFLPLIGNTMTIITASDGLSGVFDSLMLPNGFNWQVDYDADSVQLIVGIPGDYNDDGSVDAADYTVWRNTFGAIGSGLAADGNGNGSIDGGDYSVWKTNFGASAGSGAGQSIAVPEPSGAIYWMLAAIMFALSRARLSVATMRLRAAV
jgi:hypothetical protein